MSKSVGVVGGGQLAWMMGKEAPALGLKLWAQTPNPEDPAVTNATHVIYGAVDDVHCTAQLLQHCDVVTFENEFVDLDALGALENQESKFFPSLRFLAPLLDKYDQRQCCQKLRVPVPAFVPWQLGDVIPKHWSYPLVVKARRHGYDGKGTFIVKDQAALAALPEALAETPLLLEAFVPFEQELAVMVARNHQGELAVFPIVETQQVGQVCRRVLAPAAISGAIAEQVTGIAQHLAESLGLVGIMGIEFFLTAGGEILVNELAPRTHNSGHFSLDACHTSQFAMQLQAIAGFKLGNPEMISPGAVMVNLLGFEHSSSDYAHVRKQLSLRPNTFVHWYGKSSSPGRKLGHVTALSQSDNRDELLQLAQKIESQWDGASC